MKIPIKLKPWSMVWSTLHYTRRKEVLQSSTRQTCLVDLTFVEMEEECTYDHYSSVFSVVLVLLKQNILHCHSRLKKPIKVIYFERKCPPFPQLSKRENDENRKKASNEKGLINCHSRNSLEIKTNKPTNKWESLSNWQIPSQKMVKLWHGSEELIQEGSGVHVRCYARTG